MIDLVLRPAYVIGEFEKVRHFGMHGMRRRPSHFSLLVMFICRRDDARYGCRRRPSKRRSLAAGMDFEARILSAQLTVDVLSQNNPKCL